MMVFLRPLRFILKWHSFLCLRLLYRRWMNQEIDKISSYFILLEQKFFEVYLHILKHLLLNLTFIVPCIANIFVQHSQQDAAFHNLFISVRHSTCFRRVFCPTSGAQNCTYSVRNLSDWYCYLLLAWLAWSDKYGTWRCMCSFEVLMMDGKPVWNM